MCDLELFVVFCVVVCGGLRWFVVVCGGLWYLVPPCTMWEMVLFFLMIISRFLCILCRSESDHYQR